MNPFIVAFTGKAGSGKSTAATGLIRELKFEEYQFSRPLKRAVAAMLGVSPHLMEDQEFKAGHLALETPTEIFKVTPRHLLQTLGTDWARDTIHKDFWVALMERGTRECESNIVITDLRFDNEAKWVQSRGGIVVEIVRPDQESIATSDHASELGVHPSLIDFPIKNEARSANELSQYVLGEIKDYMRLNDK